MNFNKVISMAAHNEKYSSYVTPAKRYTTELPAPKKPPKSNVQSAAVKAFLAKKQQEEKVKAREFERKKQDLLELRSIAKHNRKATAMAKRTKDNNFMANFSFMEELMKNGDPSNASMLPTSYQRCPVDDRLHSLVNKKSSERNDRSPPYRGSGNDRYGSSSSRPKSEPTAAPLQRNRNGSENPGHTSATSHPADRKNGSARKPPPPQNSLNFHELLKLAAEKQHQPVEVLRTKKIVKDVDFQGRLMTNDEKRHFIEEETRKQGRSLSEVTLPTTSRRRKKFRKDAEGDELVASNLSISKTPQNVVPKNQGPSGVKSLPPIRKLTGQQQRPNTENVRARQSDPTSRTQVPSRRDRNELEKRQPIPKQNTSAAARNEQKPKPSSMQKQVQLSASKQNYPTKQVQVSQRPPAANHHLGTSTSSNLIRDERTKMPVRMPNGPVNGKIASSAKLPSQRLPQSRDTNGQVPSKMTKLRDPTVLRQLPPTGEVLKKVSSRDPMPKQLPSKTSTGKQALSRSLPPKQGPSREVLKQFPPKDLQKQFPPRDLQKQFPPRDLQKQFPPRDLQKQFPPRDLQKQFPPRDLQKQFPPRDLLPKQFPPRDMMPRQFPPRDVRRGPLKAVKRRIESDDEYDEEMDDFIDDGPIDGENMDISEQIKEIFGYDRNKYRFEPDDDLGIMESSFAQQMREEALSTKMGILEDLEDIRREQEELKGKFKNAKKKKK